MTCRAFRANNLGDIVQTDSAEAAFIDLSTGTTITLAALDARANQIANAAREQGWRKGQAIAVLSENGAAFTAAYFGLMRAGLVVVPLSTRVPPDVISYMVEDSASVAVLCSRAFRGLLSKATCIHDLAEFGEVHSTNFLTERMASGEIAEILYTSGSTGRPKGVPLSHSGQLWALRSFLEHSSGAHESTVIAAPTYHMNGLFLTTVAIALGWQTVSMPRFEARGYLDAVARYKCTTLSGIPTMFALMARESELISTLDLSSVRDVIIGSAPLTQALVERVHKMFPNAGVRNSYGTTETGPAMFGPHPEGRVRPALSIGYPYPGVECRLVGGPSADEGELETRTPATFAGYLNHHQTTANRFDEGWYKTGDVLRRDRDGFFYFVGRADDMFVCGGENVFPGEVEKLLERHPEVLQAAVVPVEDEIKGTIPIAFVTCVPGASLTEDALRGFALKNGPAYSHPRAIIFLGSLPTGATHKVDKSALRVLAIEKARSLRR